MILRKTGIAVVFALLAVCIWAAPIFAHAAAPTPVGGKVSAPSLYTGLQPADSYSGAIHRVPDNLCASRSDFVKLWNGTTIANGVCFASNGTANINVYNVSTFTSGSNVGYIIFTWTDGNSYRQDFCQGQTWGYQSNVPDVTQVVITGRTC